MVSSPRAGRRARLHLLAGGMGAAVLAVALPVLPVEAHPVAALGILGMGGWSAWGLHRLNQHKNSARWAQRRRRFPWMGKEERVPDWARRELALRELPPPDKMSFALVETGAHAQWAWFRAHWMQRADPGEEPKPPLKVWVLTLDMKDGKPLHWGRIRPRQAVFVPSGTRVALPAAWPEGFALYATDPVSAARAWNPVAAEKLGEVPVDRLLTVDSHGPRGVVVVPESWVDGDEVAHLQRLVEALRQATGRDRWDEAVGTDWAPQAP